MSSTFGHAIRITTFGESHGGYVGVTIDGCPGGWTLEVDLLQAWLDRRKPGQSHLSTPRKEDDTVIVSSGVDHSGVVLGSPVTLMVKNKNFKPEDYDDLKKVYRPSHADFTTEAKYGVRAQSGGGRSSARETIGRVAAAAFMEQYFHKSGIPIEVVAWVDSVKDIRSSIEHPEKITREDVEKTPLRCPDQNTQKDMEEQILKAKKSGDSVGGTIFFGIKNAPQGLGEPIFDKLEADLAKAMMSLPASKGFEVGSGFAGTQLYGSEHNDAFVMENDKVRTASNRSGGIQGGISNGEYIYGRVAFKPVSTIFKPQKSVTADKKEVEMKPKTGRHDPCVLPRAVPMVEAMAMLVIADHYFRQKAISP